MKNVASAVPFLERLLKPRKGRLSINHISLRIDPTPPPIVTLSKPEGRVETFGGQARRVGLQKLRNALRSGGSKLHMAQPLPGANLHLFVTDKTVLTPRRDILKDNLDPTGADAPVVFAG